ncbi:hypothetical protein L2Y96_13395 [Luteibacter aegosomaticola]|uniref:cold-shock protein n=1 Tax=Luteibacter aegosomaticola TaxID=2911538 RepID=UPI001FFB6471|nr:hypothetical protein [Luteibacter aegosomaticola]UPG88414.1 hypothetical protein L2Y96_13395 [Luteibacter aegosomaticola]
MRLRNLLRIPSWLRALFDIEVQAESRETRHIPASAPHLQPGQRVEFNVHPGEDGPWYATEVRVIRDLGGGSDATENPH